jgi:hypothetical protein
MYVPKQAGISPKKRRANRALQSAPVAPNACMNKQCPNKHSALCSLRRVMQILWFGFVIVVMFARFPINMLANVLLQKG